MRFIEQRGVQSQRAQDSADAFPKHYTLSEPLRSAGDEVPPGRFSVASGCLYVPLRLRAVSQWVERVDDPQRELILDLGETFPEPERRL